MIRKILVPLDGSTQAERVLGYVTPLASTLDAQVRLIHVVSGNSANRERSVKDSLSYRLTCAERTKYLERCSNQLRRAGVEVTTSIEPGGAAEVIVDRVRREGYDLVVLTPHGTGCSTRLHVGCTALTVAISAGTSVLMVPGEATKSARVAKGPPGPVMACVDCTRGNDRLVEIAARVAQGAGSQVTFIHLLTQPAVTGRAAMSQVANRLRKEIVALDAEEAGRYLADTLIGLKGRGIDAEGHLVEAKVDPYDQLLHTIVSQKPGLAILSAGGHGPLRKGMVAGTAAMLARCSGRAVLLLRDHEPDWCQTCDGFNHASPGRTFVVRGSYGARTSQGRETGG